MTGAARGIHSYTRNCPDGTSSDAQVKSRSDCFTYLFNGEMISELMITEGNLLTSVLESPQQVVSGRGGKKAYQSQLDFGDGKIFLLRAIVDQTVNPPMVVTVYRTSKIAKYWRTV
jgi:hypothetical protein